MVFRETVLVADLLIAALFLSIACSRHAAGSVRKRVARVRPRRRCGVAREGGLKRSTIAA